MARLPYETWSYVFRHLWEERFSFSHAERCKPDLLHLVQTCKRFNTIGIPYLYRHCPPLEDNEKTKRLLSTLISNKLAASSVRVLAAECVVDSQEEEDKVLESTGALLSTALEHLSNLTDLQLYFYKHRDQYDNFEFSSEDADRSEALAQHVLSSPQRFPFKLKSFATDLTCAPTVHSFLSTQPVQTLHWKYMREYKSGDSDEPCPLESPKSLAISLGEDFELTLDDLPSYFTLFPSIEHLLLQFRVPGIEDSYATDGIESALGRLKSLHVAGDCDKGVDGMLKSYAPHLCSLEYLYVTAGDLDVTRAECLWSLCEALDLIPSLKTVIYDDRHFSSEDLEYWLEDPKLPEGLKFYTHFEDGPVEVYKDTIEGVWKHRTLSTPTFPGMYGSGVRHDEHYRGNLEMVLNVADWPWTY